MQNRNSRNSLALALLASAGLALAACGGESSTGELSVQLTDAPVDDATAVVIEVNGVTVHGPGGQKEFGFDTPRSIDLLDLTGNTAEILIDNEVVTAGQYQWMRLDVDAGPSTMDSYIELEDGSRHSLVIPSEEQTGLKVNVPFTVPAGGTADFTIDFDVRKSVHEPGTSSIDYVLRPTLRLVDNAEVGSIAGTVDAALVTTECDPAVYLYSGSDITPDDVDANEPDPVTSAIPEMNADTGNFDYTIGFVTEGEYTVTYTCDAGIDEPDTDDDMTFSHTQNVSVTAGETTSVDFQ